MGFNLQYYKPCIVPQLTVLFCHTICFGKFNKLTSFSRYFLANIDEKHTSICFSSGARA